MGDMNTAYTTEVPICSGYFEIQKFRPKGSGGSYVPSHSQSAAAAGKGKGPEKKMVNLARKWVQFYSQSVRMYNDNNASLAVGEFFLGARPPTTGAAILKKFPFLKGEVQSDLCVVLEQDGGSQRSGSGSGSSGGGGGRGRLRGTVGQGPAMLVVQAVDKSAFKKLKVRSWECIA